MTLSFATNAWRSRWRLRVLTLAVPIIVANISVPLVGIVDTAVMGRVSDPAYIGAVALGAIIFSSIFWLFGFLKMGTGGLVAQAFGASEQPAIATPPSAPPAEPAQRAEDGPIAKNRLKVHDHHSQHSEHTTEHSESDSKSKSDSDSDSESDLNLILYRALLTGALLGLALVVLQYPIAQLAMKAFSADVALETLALDYFHVRIYAAPATLITYSILGALVGLQLMKQLLLLQLILNLSNILLTLLFFVVFNAGVKGVALATVMAEYLALAYGLHVLLKATGIWPIKSPWVKVLNPTAIKELFLVNANLLVRTLCLTASFYWITESGVRLGTLTLAANAILIHMVHFGAHALDGFAHAAETLCGNVYGRARSLANSTKNVVLRQQAVEEFKQLVIVCTIWGCLFSLLITFLYLLFGDWIIALMTTQPEVRQHASIWLWWIILSPLIGIWSFILDGIYIGVTHTRDMRNGMLQSVVTFLLANLLLVTYFGNTGLWMSYYVLMLARALTLYRTYPRIIAALQSA